MHELHNRNLFITYRALCMVKAKEANYVTKNFAGFHNHLLTMVCHITYQSCLVLLLVFLDSLHLFVLDAS